MYAFYIYVCLYTFDETTSFLSNTVHALKFGILQEAKVRLIWTAALWVNTELFGEREKSMKQQQELRDSQDKWRAACKREQTHSCAVPVTCLLPPEDSTLLLHLPILQNTNLIKKRLLVFQQQQGKHSYPVG